MTKKTKYDLNEIDNMMLIPKFMNWKDDPFRGI